jgi:lipopolysaccharide transport system ATP-binding protein
VTPAIVVRGVTKTYARGLHRSLKGQLLGGREHRFGRTTALRDVTLDVAAGRTMGLVGHNGAGKSTLLRLIGGVGRPDAGTIEVHGRTAALFELGSGFHPDLTGRESIEVTAVVSGMRRREARAATDAIIGFAELEEFVDAPLRTYSTGMQSRLAFAIAAHIEPEVLLVDEVLAVGDLAFQARCIERLRAMQLNGTTILLVSHDPGLVADLCDDVAWLRGGRVVAVGHPRDVTDRYRDVMADETRRMTPASVPDVSTPDGATLRVGENRFGSQEARITSGLLLDGWGVRCSATTSGAAAKLQVEVDVPPSLFEVMLGVTLVRSSDGALCLDTSTAVVDGVMAYELTVDRLDLAPGEYSWDIGLYSGDWSRTYDHHSRAYPMTVSGHQYGPGGPILAPPMSWRAAVRSAE